MIKFFNIKKKKFNLKIDIQFYKIFVFFTFKKQDKVE